MRKTRVGQLAATLIVLWAAALPSAATAAETFVIDKVHSEASFQVRHFVTKVRGRFTEFGGTIQVDRARPEASSVELSIQTASIDTDMQKRDQHLRSADFFDVEKYPEITFKSARIVTRGQDRYDVTGILTMHGVSREITVPVAFLGFVGAGANQKAGFEATLTLNRKDYGILWNRAMDTGGFVLGDEVFVTVNIEANPPREPAPAPPAR